MRTERRELMKKKTTVIALIVICLSLLAYGTLSYFTAKDTGHNVITTCGIDIELQEWANTDKTEAFPADGVSGVMPGTTVTKIAEVKNTGSSAAYVRAKADKKVILADESIGDASPVTIDFNTTDWTLKDGYYYYNKALEPGKTTEPLFTKVSFDKNMSNTYQNSKAIVDVSAYATQAANNGSDPLTAQGWPED